LRKLLLSSISLQIAQNIGIDYHAATEELYYYIRKNEQNTNQHLIRFIDSFYEKIIRQNKWDISGGSCKSFSKFWETFIMINLLTNSTE